MNIKKLSLKLAILCLISFNAFSQSSNVLSSFEEFEKWEKNLKMNASFNSNYKVPDYIRVGASSLSSAESRYSFFKNNPQYLADYENIHKGQLSTQTTDGTTIIKSKYEDMPSDIAEYYKKNPAELLAAEGFGFDPVLARKVYTGEIQLPYGVNKTEWLRQHAWTPNGIVEKNNPVAYSQADYSGGYVLNKIDPATGKPVESTSGQNGQVAGNLALLKTVQNDMGIILGKAKVIRESLETSLQTSDNAPASIDCAGEVQDRFKGRCKELLVLIKSYKDLEANAEKLRSIISSVDKSVAFPKIAYDTTPVSSSVVNKGSKDVFAADKETPNCTAPSLQGWKCLKTKITTLEGKSYNILLKWNRPNQKSKGTVFYGIGGAGMGESRDDAPSKAVMDQLDQIDQIRTVALEMLDEKPDFPLAGGYWIHAGGYETLAQILMATLELSVKKTLFHGNFTNYYGGSNGSMMLASAMSRYNADAYFDRAIFQMGPFLPDLKTACDKNSASSFTLSNEKQQAMTQDFLSRWMYQDPSKKVCDDLSNTRLSLLAASPKFVSAGVPGVQEVHAQAVDKLASKNFKKDYPNLIIHVIMGQKESTDGFGNWILASNLEWFNAITAKAKDRLIRPNMGHNNSYEDMRRFIKLAPNENPDRTLEQCRYGTFEANGGLFEYSCGCGTVEGGVLQNDGCFHKAKGN